MIGEEKPSASTALANFEENFIGTLANIYGKLIIIGDNSATFLKLMDQFAI